jgi:hypothetical protein
LIEHRATSEFWQHYHALPPHIRTSADKEHGDVLIVWKLDRLGRSLHDLITMLDDLKHRGVKFRSLTEAVDTETLTPLMADDWYSTSPPHPLPPYPHQPFQPATTA